MKYLFIHKEHRLNPIVYFPNYRVNGIVDTLSSKLAIIDYFNFEFQFLFVLTIKFRYSIRKLVFISERLVCKK